MWFGKRYFVDSLQAAEEQTIELITHDQLREDMVRIRRLMALARLGRVDIYFAASIVEQLSGTLDLTARAQVRARVDEILEVA